MDAAEGPVHIAGPAQEDGLQLCQRCHTQLAGPITMVPPGMSIEEAQALEPETFPEDAYVLEVSEDAGGVVMQVHFEEIPEAEIALGAYLMCGESGWQA